MKTQELGGKGRTEIFQAVGSAKVACWGWVIVLALLLLPSWSFAEADPPPPCTPTICSWECLTTGAVDNPGKLSKTNVIICVGDAIEKPGFGTATFTPGTKKQKCVNPCTTTYGEPVNITYSQTNWFEPELPTNITACGESSYTAYVKGVDADCSPTEKTFVGTFKVKAVAVASLTPSEGTLVAGSDPPVYKICSGSGDVVVNAANCPGVAEADLLSCWSFTGGTAVGTGKIQRKISKSISIETNTFTVTAGTSSKTIKIVFGCPCNTPISGAEWSYLHGLFPNLVQCNICKLGEATPGTPYVTPGCYNCLSHVMDDNWMWYWRQASSTGTSESVSADEMTTFLGSWGGGVPHGIAYYGPNSSNLRHVAKKTGGIGSDCMASSKLGHYIKIAHKLSELEGTTYGNIVGEY